MLHSNSGIFFVGLALEVVSHVRASGLKPPAGRGRLAAGLFVLLSICNGIAAQERGGEMGRGQSAAPITATATAERVRFHSPGEVTEIRVEVFDGAGERVFDSGFKRGNLLDWPMQEQQGNRLADASYLCVATARDLRGRHIRRAGLLTLVSGQGSLEQLNAERLTTGQAQILEAGRQSREGLAGEDGSDESLTVLHAGEAAALAVTAHDGRNGSLTSTAGDLIFSTGNLFGAEEKERIRVTADGRVGVGTSTPKERLDVEGYVRTSRGVVFPDGTVQTSAAGTSRFSSRAAAEAARSASKQSAAGKESLTLADPPLMANQSVDGDIVFTSPGFANYARDIRLSDNLGGLRFYASASLMTQTQGAAIQFFGNGHTLFPGQAFIDSGSHNSAAVIFRTAPAGAAVVERMRVTSAGNVGIGNSNPLRALQIGPSLNAAFTLEQGDSPNAGFIRFGDTTGWKLHFARQRERSVGPLNNGTTGVLMTIQDNGHVGVGTTTPQAKLDVRGDVKLGNSGQLFAPGGEENLRIIRGVISQHGFITSGSGFSVVHTETGIYDVTFDAPFADIPAITATAEYLGLDGFAQRILIRTSNHSRGFVRFHLSAEKLAEFLYERSHAFHFIAIGAR
jgi:hypothetical protein